MAVPSVVTAGTWTDGELATAAKIFSRISTPINDRTAWFDQISFTPGGTVAMTTGGTSTWLTLGNVTVPTWATSAIVTWTIGGLFDPGTTGFSSAVLKIGTATGNAARMLGPGLAGQRFTFTYNDTIASPPTGSQSVTVQTTWTSGTLYTVDVNCRVSAVFIWRP